MSWPKVELNSVVEILDSMRIPVKAGNRIEGPYPYYGANGQQGTINDFIFDEPLILVAEDGGHFFDSSRPIAYRIEGKTWVNNHAHVLRCNPDMDISYLCHQLARYNVQQYLTGSTRAKLTKGALERITITKPPLKEQKRISAILDKTDQIIQSVGRVNKNRDIIIQSVFTSLFGDVIQNTFDFPIRELGQIVSVNMGQSPSGESYNETGEGTPFLQGNAEFSTLYPNHKKWTTAPHKMSNKGDILFSVRAPVGAINIADQEYCIGRGLAAIEPNETLNQEYLQYCLFFLAEILKSKATGSTFKAVTGKTLKLFEIPLPPSKLQQQFSSYVSTIRKIDFSRTLSNSIELKNAIYQEMFT